MYFDAPSVIKGIERYYCEINIDSSYETRIADEWGAAYVFNRWGQGAEYRFNYDGRNEQSAIYRLDEYGHTYKSSVDDREYYEIDFGDDNWEEKLTDAMIRCVDEWWDKE